MKLANVRFTADGTKTFEADGIYHAVQVSGTFTNVVISDVFNGTVYTVTNNDPVYLSTDSFGIHGEVSVTTTGVSGTVIANIQWVEL